MILAKTTEKGKYEKLEEFQLITCQVLRHKVLHQAPCKQENIFLVIV